MSPTTETLPSPVVPRARIAATVEESTPPDMATAMVVWCVMGKIRGGVESRLSSAYLFYDPEAKAAERDTDCHGIPAGA